MGETPRTWKSLTLCCLFIWECRTKIRALWLWELLKRSSCGAPSLVLQLEENPWNAFFYRTWHLDRASAVVRLSDLGKCWAVRLIFFFVLINVCICVVRLVVIYFHLAPSAWSGMLPPCHRLIATFCGCPRQGIIHTTKTTNSFSFSHLFLGCTNVQLVKKDSQEV